MLPHLFSDIRIALLFFQRLTGSHQKSGEKVSFVLKESLDYTSIVSSFLPEGILDHFVITDFQEHLHKPADKKPSFYIYLEEKNELPPLYDSTAYESKGFYEEKMIQDFPIRGKSLYLIVKRRRWRLKSDHNIMIKSDYSFIAKGVKLTQQQQFS